MSDIPFNRHLEFRYGVIEPVAPRMRRLVARNPGPFTFHGTGTYIVGHGEVAVIDPGPDLPEHVDALLRGLAGERVTHILVTHTHRDHSPASRPLRDATGATVYAWGPHGIGQADSQVEEGADREFAPDATVRHGDLIEGRGWSFECVHTPGHTSNHMCYQLCEQRALFCGDHVMAWNTTVIAPPDGDMTDYLASLQLLLGRDDRSLWPTHGPPVDDPKPFLRAYLEHRYARERQIIAELRSGTHRVREMVVHLYRDLPLSLHPAAQCSVLATLIHLHRQGRVSADGPPGLHARFVLSLEHR